MLLLNLPSLLMLFTFISGTLAYVRYGRDANIVGGLFAYIVHVRVRLPSEPGKVKHTQCGGTMLTPSIVYTACHCFHHEGHYHKEGHVEVYSYMPHFTAKIKNRKLFKFKEVWFPSQGCMTARGGVDSPKDYALIFLEKSVETPEYPEFNICESEKGPIIPLLPPNWTEVTSTRLLSHPANCFLAGFGWTERPGNDNRLRYIHAETIDKGDTEFVVGFKLVEGGKASGACPGDSGGPFICVHKDKPYVLGVVSGGTERHRQIVPGDMTQGHINCQNRADHTFFSNLNNHYKVLMDVIARKRPNELQHVGKWQEKCNKYYERVKYSTRNMTAYHIETESTSTPNLSAITVLLSIVVYVFSDVSF